MILDPAQAHLEQLINLHVDRNGQVIDISFKPEGLLTKKYLWRRAENGAATTCHI